MYLLKKKIKTEKTKDITSDVITHNQKKIKKKPIEEVQIKEEVINLGKILILRNSRS